MNVLIFDTETTDINKCFCYNAAYVIVDIDNDNILCKKDFVIEQIWHNLPLFSTAYYAEKRPIYVKAMRSKKAKMTKYGYFCQEMARDIKKFNVACAYAYNSQFDEKVFAFNCDWYKCSNPLDTIPVFDIMGNVHNFLVDDRYIRFCEKNEKFTDSGNYSTTAETVYQYITNNTDFVEEHTALSDSLIEYEILKETLKNGSKIMVGYNKKRTIPRETEKIFIVKDKNDGIIFSTECKSFKVYKKKNMVMVKR